MADWISDRLTEIGVCVCVCVCLGARLETELLQDVGVDGRMLLNTECHVLRDMYWCVGYLLWDCKGMWKD